MKTNRPNPINYFIWLIECQNNCRGTAEVISWGDLQMIINIKESFLVFQPIKIKRWDNKIKYWRYSEPQAVEQTLFSDRSQNLIKVDKNAISPILGAILYPALKPLQLDKNGEIRGTIPLLPSASWKNSVEYQTCPVPKALFLGNFYEDGTSASGVFISGDGIGWIGVFSFKHQET